MKVFRTNNYNQVFQLCNTAIETRTRVACVAGDRGQGATLALSHFYNTHKNSCLYGDFKGGLTLRKFLTALLKEIRTEYYLTDEGEKYAFEYVADEYVLVNEFIKALMASGRRLLIIDGFSSQLISLCQHLSETDRHSISLIICCRKNVLTALKRRQESDPAIKKLLSRVTCFNRLITLNPPRKDEVKEILAAYGVENNVEQFSKVKSFRHLYFNILQITKQLPA